MQLTQAYTRGKETFEAGPFDPERPGAAKVARIAARAGHLVPDPPPAPPKSKPKAEKEADHPHVEGVPEPDPGG